MVMSTAGIGYRTILATQTLNSSSTMAMRTTTPAIVRLADWRLDKAEAARLRWRPTAPETVAGSQV